MDRVPDIVKLEDGKYKLFDRENKKLFRILNPRVEDNNVENLKYLAKYLGIKGYSKMKRAEIVRAIQAQLGLEVSGLTQAEIKNLEILNQPDSPEPVKNVLSQQDVKNLVGKNANLPVHRSFYDNPLFDMNVLRTIRQYANKDINYDWLIETGEYTKALKWILSRNLLNHAENFMLNYGDLVDWNKGSGYIVRYNDIRKFYPTFVITKITDWNDFLAAAIVKKDWKLIECINLIKHVINLDIKKISEAIGESGSIDMFNYIVTYYLGTPDWSELLLGACISGRKSLVRKALNSGANIKKMDAYALAMKYGNPEVSKLISPDRRLSIESIYYGYGYSGKTPPDINNISHDNLIAMFAGAIEANNEKIIREYKDKVLNKEIFREKKYILIEAAMKGDNKYAVELILGVSEGNDIFQYIRAAMRSKKVNFVKYFLGFVTNKKMAESFLADILYDLHRDSSPENLEIYRYIVDRYEFSADMIKNVINSHFRENSKIKLLKLLGLE